MKNLTIGFGVPRTIFHLPVSSGSLVISIRPKAKWTFREYIFIRENYVTKLHIFETLLCPHARKLEMTLGHSDFRNSHCRHVGIMEIGN